MSFGASDLRYTLLLLLMCALYFRYTLLTSWTLRRCNHGRAPKIKNRTQHCKVDLRQQPLPNSRLLVLGFLYCFLKRHLCAGGGKRPLSTVIAYHCQASLLVSASYTLLVQEFSSEAKYQARRAHPIMTKNYWLYLQLVCTLCAKCLAACP